MIGRRLAGGLVALALFAFPALAADPEVLYRGATVIDVANGTAAPGMAILTRGEIIEAVGPAYSLTPPPGARVVDVGGLFATPGLVNSHEHLATPPNRPFAEAMMRRDLYGGITTVRDMADDLRQLADLSRASLVGEIPGPDIYYAALMAGPEFFEDPRTHETTRGAVAGQAPWMQAVTDQTDLPLAVARAQGTGATAIKIYADLPGDLVARITHEAHRQGMRVWAHAAVFPASPAEVLDAGVDSVSHVCMLAYQASDVMPRAYHNRAPVDAARFQAGDSPAVQRLFDQIRDRGVILDATLWVYDEMAQEHAAHPAGPAPYCSTALAERLANQAWRSGDLIVTGTDGFSPGTDPWPALDDELVLLQDKAGMKPADVLRAATLTGAMVVGRQREIGTIEPGKLANLVFVRRDPLKDMRAFKTVVLTVKRGKEFWRKDFRPVTAEEMNGEE
jgi:imidazolonepropionase-like amidohydrolase